MASKNQTQRSSAPLAGYTRVSSLGDRDKEELHSHDLQRELIEAGAKGLGHALAEERFEDTDASGGTMDRPAFNEVMDGIRAGKFGGIIVAKLSRFGRTVSGALKAIEEIEERNCTFVCLDPPIDTSTSSGRFIRTVFLGLYEMERENTAEGQLHLLDKKIEAGIHQSTVAPAGYDFSVAGYKTSKDGARVPIRGPLVKNSHAPAVKRAFEIRADGGAWLAVVKHLTESGVPSRTGRWSYTGARSLIENKVYLGIAYSATREKKGAHPAIVKPSLFAAANATIGTRKRTEEVGAVLAGIVKCAVCGGAMTRDWTTSKSGKKYVNYKCKSNPGCPSRTHGISALQIEPYVAEAAFAALGTVAYEEAEDADQAATEFDGEFKALDEQEAELNEMLDSGEASFAAHAIALTKLEEARAALRAKNPSRVRGSVRTVFTGEAGVRAAFENSPPAARRAFLSWFVQRVEVKPGRAPLKERVTLTLTDFDPAAHGLIAVQLDVEGAEKVLADARAGKEAA